MWIFKLITYGLFYRPSTPNLVLGVCGIIVTIIILFQEFDWFLERWYSRLVPYALFIIGSIGWIITRFDSNFGGTIHKICWGLSIAILVIYVLSRICYWILEEFGIVVTVLALVLIGTIILWGLQLVYIAKIATIITIILFIIVCIIRGKTI